MAARVKEAKVAQRRPAAARVRERAVAREDVPTSQRRAVDWGWLGRAAVIVLAVFWIYGPVLRGEFVWDDTELVSQNKVILDPAGFWKIWFQPSCLFDYQPLKFTVVWLQWRLWGADTLGYHLTNVVLHILSALLVWRLLARLGLKLAWVGGLLFAVHPLQVESVAWISELKNTLSLPPFLLAMLAYLDFDERGRGRDYALALTLFVVAMLVKTTMMMFPFVILLYAWWKRGRVVWRDVRASAPFLVVSLALGLATLWAQHLHEPVEVQHAPPVDFLTRFVVTGLLIGFAIGKFGCPLAFSPTYPRWQFPAGGLPLYGAPWLLLVGWLSWCWWKRSAWGRGALLGTGFFLLNLVPPLEFLVTRYNTAVWSLDHLFYVPVIGLIGLAVAGLGLLDARLSNRWRPAWIVPLTLALVLMAVESRSYAALFNRAKSLWTYCLVHDPQSIVAHINLGQVLADEGQVAEAAAQFRIVLAEAPFHAKAHYNLANELVRLDRKPEAIAEFEQALQLDPGLRQGHINLGLLFQQSGRAPEALDQFQQAVKLDDDDAKGHVTLGEALREAGRLDEASAEYQRALQLAPDDVEPHHGLAEIALRQGRAADALAECDTVLQRQPDFADCHFIRGIVEMFSGQDVAANDDFTKAIKFDPHLADAYFRRGTVRQMRGDLVGALADLREGCRLAPKDGLADYARLSIWVLAAQLGQKTDADRDLAAALAGSWNGAAKDWVTVLGRFLLGQVTQPDLLAAAGGGVPTCEAWYFAGMKALAVCDKATALDDLQRCVATNQHNSIKWRLAQAQLALLGAN